MKKQSLLIALALLGFTLPACNKKETASTPEGQPAQPAASSEAKLRAAYGFAAQVPSDAEAYVAFYKLGKLWHDFKGSKTFASILANPMFAQAGGPAALDNGLAKIKSDPEGAKWLGIVKEALGNESFVSFAPGSAKSLRQWLNISNEMRAAQIRSGFAAGVKKEKAASKPDEMFAGMLPYLKTLDFPPVVIGFKLGAQKAALAAELEQAVKNLPPTVEQGAFNLNGSVPFKSITVTTSKVLPAPQQEALKKFVSDKIADPKVAEETFQSLLARHIEVAYGFIGDYFVASIGSDHSHLKTSAGFADSLLARPEIKQVEPYADKALLSFSYSNADFIAASQQKLELTPWLERFKTDLAGQVAPADMQKLEADLKRIDEKGSKVFPHDFSPMVGVSYRDHGLRGEAFGGFKSTLSAAKPLQFSGVVTDSTLLWVDAQSSQEAQTACFDWIEDLATTTYDTFQRLVLPKLGDQQRMQFGMMQGLVVPKITEYYRISHDQLAKSLGFEVAFAIDGGGEMPAIPMIPQQIRDGGKMLRLAILRDVRDRALLGESWKSYFKLARDIALMIPQTAKLPGGLPEPASETVDGVTLSYYPLPLPTGDLLPNIATTDKTMVMTTSRSYALELSKAAAKPASQKPLALDLRLNTKSACDFADKWMAVVAQNPELFFQGNQAKADEFKKNQPAFSALLHSLRAFEGMDVQVSEENGVRRTSSAIRWHE